MFNIPVEKLKFKSNFGINYGKYQEGYRMVYLYPDNEYEIGTFCGRLEDFMMDFVEIEPIEDDSDIPKFVSIEDLLERYLADAKDAIAVAIYKTDGTMVAKKKRNKVNNIKTKYLN